MKQKINIKQLLYFFLFCLSALFLFCIFLQNEKCGEKIDFANASENCRIEYVDEQSASLPYYDTSYSSYSDLTYKSYAKGMKQVNVVFNFVNYPNDKENMFTPDEIHSKLAEFQKDVDKYFERMSQGFVEIELDYVCSIAPESYDYYHSLPDASYGTELDIFNKALENKLDENGKLKNFKFKEFHLRVNAFAGKTGAWSTFLWPHAFSSSGLIMMMESRMVSGTLCHEMMHTFGVNDLYSYTGSQSFSAQNLDLMGTSSKNLATNAYFREKVGWLVSSDYYDEEITAIEEIPSRQKGSLSLDLYVNCTDNYKKTIAYKFGENPTNGEFFMIEYRIKGYQEFDNSVPNTSVIIYRVNPKAIRGNVNGNSPGNYYNEIIFMGNSTIDVSSQSYTTSCLLTEGSVYGSRGDATNTSLVYASAGGKDNLFNGENSGISVKIDSLESEFATITITFKQDSESIDLSKLKWSQSSFDYDGAEHTVKLLNIDKHLTVTYTGTTNAVNAGQYTVNVSLDYDKLSYHIINDSLVKKLTWKIVPASITLKADDKTSKYGESIKELTYSITEGVIYNNDSLNIELTKDKGKNAGDYRISISAKNNNYNIRLVNGNYTITPRVVKLKIQNQNYEIADFVEVDQTKYEVLAGGDEILSGDQLNISIKAKDLEGIKTGTYILTASYNNSNYKIVIDNGILTITADLDSIWVLLLAIILPVAVFGIGEIICIFVRRRKKFKLWNNYPC